MSLEIPDAEIKGIMSQGDIGVQRIKLLKCWKQRRGSEATYKALVGAFLQIGRTDQAERVMTLLKLEKCSLVIPSSSASSSEEEIPPPEESKAKIVKETLQKLEEEFLELVIYIESTLVCYHNQ